MNRRGACYSFPMSHYVPGLPAEGEYPPYAARYVETVSESDIVSALRAQVEETAGALSGADPEWARSFRYAEGKWTLNEVVGHITDTERVFNYRTLCVARGDTTPLPGFEQDDYVKGGPFGECSLEELVEEYRLVRAVTLSLLEKLRPEAWMRKGTASGYPVTVRGLAALTLGHERYHLGIVKERYLAGR